MDFEKAHMPSILKSGMRNKFMDFPPFDFEDFIAQMFKDNGYLVEKTSRTGDYGADLVIMKDNIKTAVQIKRYSPNNKVGVQEINQVIGSRDYYKCDRGIVITTSSFTPQGKQLASETGIELWEWDKLQKYICDTYLDGKDYYQYFKSSVKKSGEDGIFKLELKKVEYNVQMKRAGVGTILYMNLTNLTVANDYILLAKPIYISSENKQIEAQALFEGYFDEGVIYSGCTVELGFVFLKDQLSSIKVGDRIIFSWKYPDSDLVFSIDYTISSLPQIISSSPCYIVTMCCGINSREYKDMVFYRDKILNKYYYGKLAVKIYYVLGKHLITIFGNNYFVRTLSRCILKGILKPVNYWNNRILSQCWEYRDHDR